VHRLGSNIVCSCVSPDHGAEKPARSINAEKSNGLHRHDSFKFGTKWAFNLGDSAALSFNLFLDLGSDPVPQSTGARSGKRLELESRTVALQRDSHNAVFGLVDFQPKQHPPAWFNPKAA
jgi:hypothetical protein